MGSQPQPLRLSNGSNAVNDRTDDTALKLYMLEYERCAIRYEDIYKAVWTNFSYMAILAGGIVTFGGDRVQPEVSALIACLPLFFWYFATFEPLNEYGDQVVERLSRIEKIVNKKYSLDPDPETGEQTGSGLRHFTDFQARRQELKLRRVRNVVRGCFALLVVIAVLLGYTVYGLRQAGVPLVHRKPSRTKVSAIDFKHKPAKVKVAEIEMPS